MKKRWSSPVLGLMDATSKVNGFVLDWPQSATAVSTAKHAPTVLRVISISFQARLLLESKTIQKLKAFASFLKMIDPVNLDARHVLETPGSPATSLFCHTHISCREGLSRIWPAPVWPCPPPPPLSRSPF